MNNMQVFLPSSDCLQTAVQLDKRRLNKQIIEAGQILRAIDRTSQENGMWWTDRHCGM